VDDFTEEEAARKLVSLGFEVVPAGDLDFVGYSIEANGDGWGVWRLNRYPISGLIIRMSLSGRLPNQLSCAVWLVEYLTDLRD
jgi:hypothetical protein